MGDQDRRDLRAPGVARIGLASVACRATSPSGIDRDVECAGRTSRGWDRDRLGPACGTSPALAGAARPCPARVAGRSRRAVRGAEAEARRSPAAAAARLAGRPFTAAATRGRSTRSERSGPTAPRPGPAERRPAARSTGARPAAADVRSTAAAGRTPLDPRWQRRPPRQRAAARPEPRRPRPARPTRDGCPQPDPRPRATRSRPGQPRRWPAAATGAAQLRPAARSARRSPVAPAAAAAEPGCRLRSAGRRLPPPLAAPPPPVAAAGRRRRRPSPGPPARRIEWRQARPEQELDRAVAVLRRKLGKPRVLAFANPKGGVHKTTATVLAAATIGSVRGRGVLAWDDNELRGTLGLRAGSARHARTIRHLVADLLQIETLHGDELMQRPGRLPAARLRRLVRRAGRRGEPALRPAARPEHRAPGAGPAAPHPRRDLRRHRQQRGERQLADRDAGRPTSW